MRSFDQLASDKIKEFADRGDLNMTDLTKDEGDEPVHKR
jgi:hypothetical protein